MSTGQAWPRGHDVAPGRRGAGVLLALRAAAAFLLHGGAHSGCPGSAVLSRPGRPAWLLAPFVTCPRAAEAARAALGGENPNPRASKLAAAKENLSSGGRHSVMPRRGTGPVTRSSGEPAPSAHPACLPRSNPFVTQGRPSPLWMEQG